MTWNALCLKLFLSFPKIGCTFCMSQQVHGEPWVSRHRWSFSLLRKPTIIPEISQRATKEDVGGLLLSLVRRSRFDAGTQTSVSRHQHWRSRRGHSVDSPVGNAKGLFPHRLLSAKFSPALRVASRRIASLDEWTRAKTRTQQSG